MEKEICPVCKKIQPDDADFCYHCGEPLTEIAKKIVSIQKKNHQLEMIYQLLPMIKDARTLELLKKIAENSQSKN